MAFLKSGAIFFRIAGVTGVVHSQGAKDILAEEGPVVLPRDDLDDMGEKIVVGIAVISLVVFLVKYWIPKNERMVEEAAIAA